MKIIEALQMAGVGIIFLVALGAGIGGFWYAFNSKDRKLLKEQVDELRVLVVACETKHSESILSIQNLQGQISSIRDIPLVGIHEELTAIRVINAEILKTLKITDITSTRTITRKANLIGGTA